MEWDLGGSGEIDKDSNQDSKIEKEILVPRAGIESGIIPAWEEIIIQRKYPQENFIYLILII